MLALDALGHNITPCQQCGGPNGIEVGFPSGDRLVLCPGCDKKEGQARAVAAERAGWNIEGGVGKTYEHKRLFKTERREAEVGVTERDAPHGLLNERTRTRRKAPRKRKS